MMIPWYYAVATFFLGMLVLLALGLCVAMSKPTPKPKGADRRKHVPPGRWAHPERRKQ